MRAKGVSGKRSIHMAAAGCILGAVMCWMAAVPVQAAEPGNDGEAVRAHRTAGGG